MWFRLIRRLFFRRTPSCAACVRFPARADGFCSDACARTNYLYS
jgi:hypothetical protein